MSTISKAQLAHRAALHAQAIAAGSEAPTGLHPLLESILRGQMQAQVATAEAMRAANDLQAAEHGYRWPAVDRHQHPAKHVHVAAERRTGPRASRFADLERS